ncbi:alpha-L-arabinofuranosidase C-terminal domain-containing protein, partial [Acinetobacter sp. NS4_7]
AWRQTTFHPFRLTAEAATGRVVPVDVRGARISTARHGEVDAVDAIATVDGGTAHIFLAHRSLDAETDVELDLGAVASA